MLLLLFFSIYQIEPTFSLIDYFTLVFLFIPITSENFPNKQFLPLFRIQTHFPALCYRRTRNNKYQTQNDLVDIIKRRKAISRNKNILASDSVNFKNCHEIDKCYRWKITKCGVYIYFYTWMYGRTPAKYISLYKANTIRLFTIMRY